jgi:ABC-type multidrug transport system fused ATPase/permease subunit
MENKKRFKIFLVALLAVILLLGVATCARFISARKFDRVSDRKQNQVYQEKMPVQGSGMMQNFSEAEFFPRLDTQRATLALKVQNFSQAVEYFKQIAQEKGGKISFSDLGLASSENKSGIMVIEVPKDNFDNAYNDLRNVGSLVVQETKVKGVEKNPVSLEDQIDIKKKELDALNKILENPSSAQDVITASQNINPLRVEISNLEALLGQEKPADVSYIKLIFVQSGRNYGVISMSSRVAPMMNANVVNFDYSKQIGRIVLMSSLLLLLVAFMIWFFGKLYRQSKAKKKPAIPATKRIIRPMKPVVRRAATSKTSKATKRK